MDDIVLAPARRLSGEAAVAGDKSVSHRALILSSLARGRSVIENLAAFVIYDTWQIQTRLNADWAERYGS